MGERIVLTTRAGERLAAYHAQAREARRGGLVILHAIWGVTPHIRELADTLLEGQDQARPIGADELRELLTGD